MYKLCSHIDTHNIYQRITYQYISLFISLVHALLTSPRFVFGLYIAYVLWLV